MSSNVVTGNTMTSNTMTDAGLLSIINDALPGCSYNQQFYDWARMAGMKSVAKGAACPTGYIAAGADVQPPGLKGNSTYDTCVSTTVSGAPMSNDLFKGLMSCSSSPFGPSGPKKLTWWQWLLISFAILIGIILGLYGAYKFYATRSSV